jgi:hypothetical protein
MENIAQLPKGIWYEAPKRRYRVRRYHNKITYLKGYYRTYGAACAAMDELNAELSMIPKEKRQRRKSIGKTTSGHQSLPIDIPNS